MNRAALVLGGLGGLAALALLHDPARQAVTDTADELTDRWTMDLDAAILEHPNLRAFLMMIRAGEGTADANGYRRLFGGALFDDYADHPRTRVTRRAGAGTLTSTAAGAYQILAKTWDSYRAAWGLTDFSPPSQDAFAVGLIRQRGALADVLSGRFAEAIRKCAKEWASLPGSPYGQPTKTLAQARAVYEQHGGTYA